MRGFYGVYIFYTYYFARPHKLQSFNLYRAEIKVVCLSVCLPPQGMVFDPFRSEKGEKILTIMVLNRVWFSREP